MHAPNAPPALRAGCIPVRAYPLVASGKDINARKKRRDDGVIDVDSEAVSTSNGRSSASPEPSNVSARQGC